MCTAPFQAPRILGLGGLAEEINECIKQKYQKGYGEDKYGRGSNCVIEYLDRVLWEGGHDEREPMAGRCQMVGVSPHKLGAATLLRVLPCGHELVELAVLFAHHNFSGRELTNA